mmetsp:Transcript_101949/g.266112  ORF Transcript_101949/g.266112 Transcript_101949/m.266112 type:complete len:209 (+) Transcript_101949:455-1081(+)
MLQSALCNLLTIQWPPRIFPSRGPPTSACPPAHLFHSRHTAAHSLLLLLLLISSFTSSTPPQSARHILGPSLTTAGTLLNFLLESIGLSSEFAVGHHPLELHLATRLHFGFRGSAPRHALGRHHTALPLSLDYHASSQDNIMSVHQTCRTHSFSLCGRASAFISTAERGSCTMPSHTGLRIPSRRPSSSSLTCHWYCEAGDGRSLVAH